jgi:iron(III) transport system substrate-binding protein
VAKGEVGIGVSFIFGFENERQHQHLSREVGAPCEGTGYEIGGIALVKGARNKEAASATTTG